MAAMVISQRFEHMFCFHDHIIRYYMVTCQGVIRQKCPSVDLSQPPDRRYPRNRLRGCHNRAQCWKISEILMTKSVSAGLNYQAIRAILGSLGARNHRVGYSPRPCIVKDTRPFPTPFDLAAICIGETWVAWIKILHCLYHRSLLPSCRAGFN